MQKMFGFIRQQQHMHTSKCHTVGSVPLGPWRVVTSQAHYKKKCSAVFLGGVLWPFQRWAKGIKDARFLACRQFCGFFFLVSCGFLGNPGNCIIPKGIARLEGIEATLQHVNLQGVFLEVCKGLEYYKQVRYLVFEGFEKWLVSSRATSCEITLGDCTLSRCHSNGRAVSSSPSVSPPGHGWLWGGW